MTEDQKYQGALYRNKKAKTAPTAVAPVENKTMAHTAYVEDVPDEYGAWRDYEQASDDDGRSAATPPPEAPTPPSTSEAHVNVFDFLVANPTPTASSLSLPATAPVQLSEDTQLVRFDYEANGLLDALEMDEDAMIQYGAGPVPTSFRTPAPKSERKKAKETGSEAKKDKKRKRLHIETDHVMTDAPPVLHSGLTGGLNRLMNRPAVFPPSPDYSGGDSAETPASPLKKSKHSKHHKSGRAEGISNSLMAIIAAGTGAGVKSSKSKSSKKRKSSSATTSTKKKHTKRLEAPKEQKLLEYQPVPKDSDSKDGENANPGQLVVYKPRAEHFLSFVNKGPESERGCSVNKALKRFHRERSESCTSLNKLMEEKELWRSLRMRKNERGEIVLFCI